MPGKEPAMAVEILDAVLAFSIDGFVELFPDDSALFFGSRMVGIDVSDKDGEHLGVQADGNWALGSIARAGDHDPGWAEMHLDAARRIPVAVVLDEAEDPGEPGAGLCYIAIDEVRKHDIRGDGAVFHSAIMLPVSGQG